MTKILLYIFIFTALISSKDRYQVPSNYLFEFKDSTSIELRDDQKSNLIEIDSQITKGQKKLKVAILKFKTGEVLEFRQKKDQWKEIKVTYKNREIQIPKSVLKKIGLIHFSKIEYIWHRGSENPFDADYSSINFPFGNTKIFNKLPEIRLGFSKDKFEDAQIKKYIEKNSYKYFEL